MKLYTIYVDKGDYDDWVHYPIGTFDSFDKAEKAKRKITAMIQEQRQKYTIEDHCKFSVESEFFPRSKEYDTYYNWKLEDWDKWNIDNFSIKESELNNLEDLI